MNPTVMLESLCCYFCIRMPYLKTYDRYGGGSYTYEYRRRLGRIVGTREHRIVLNLKHSKGIETLLLHEFAHYLCHSRAGFSPYREGGHGPGFRRALTDVAWAWFGDPRKYSWGTEYKRLRSGPSEFTPGELP